MEQQNKYYTPDVSELHVGYECQIGNLFALPGSRWEWAETKPLKWSTIAFIAQAMIPEHLVYIRTKYLDQSDIESCGWEQMISNNIDDNECIFRIGNIQLDYNTDTNWLYINDRIEYDKCFKGECKSINELRTIMKWLNIK